MLIRESLSGLEDIIKLLPGSSHADIKAKSVKGKRNCGCLLVAMGKSETSKQIELGNYESPLSTAFCLASGV